MSTGHRRLHAAIAETKLTKKFITDEEGTDRPLPRIVAEKPPYVLSANIESHGHIASCPRYALLTLQGKATKPRKEEFRERVGTIIERTLAGEAGMETCSTRTESLRESEFERGEELELSEVQWMCLRNPGMKVMSTCGRIWRLHHREPARRGKNERDIQVSKRGSGETSEEP